jgi:hypothetical protein
MLFAKDRKKTRQHAPRVNEALAASNQHVHYIVHVVLFSYTCLINCTTKKRE